MKKSLEIDVVDLVDILEGFAQKLDKMAEPDLIDLAARLKPAAKHIEAIDKFTKELIKGKLKHREGNRAGGLFKAVLKLVAVRRLDQKLFKEKEPDMYEQFARDDTDERITFEVR